MNSKYLAKEIKTILTKKGIKASVRSEYRHVYITYKSEVTNAIHEEIKAMETLCAHGDLMNDTRYYTGISLTFKYDFPVNESVVDKANEIIKNWGGLELINADHSKGYHVNKDILEAVGYPAYRAYMNNAELRQVW